MLQYEAHVHTFDKINGSSPLHDACFSGSLKYCLPILAILACFCHFLISHSYFVRFLTHLLGVCWLLSGAWSLMSAGWALGAHRLTRIMMLDWCVFGLWVEPGV